MATTDGTEHGSEMAAPLAIDALFVLECGCILDGCRGSHPGLAWRSGVRDGRLRCATHGWQRLTDMVDLGAPTREAGDA